MNMVITGEKLVSCLSLLNILFWSISLVYSVITNNYFVNLEIYLLFLGASLLFYSDKEVKKHRSRNKRNNKNN